MVRNMPEIIKEIGSRCPKICITMCNSAGASFKFFHDGIRTLPNDLPPVENELISGPFLIGKDDVLAMLQDCAICSGFICHSSPQ
jgi:hypothetical protein